MGAGHANYAQSHQPSPPVLMALLTSIGPLGFVNPLRTAGYRTPRRLPANQGLRAYADCRCVF